MQFFRWLAFPRKTKDKQEEDQLAAFLVSFDHGGNHRASYRAGDR
jgi:hypothetical protein